LLKVHIRDKCEFCLEEKGHNPVGVHACYKALRAFLYWWEEEVEPDNWKNPIRKVNAPRVKEEPLDPVEIATVKKLIKECPKGTFNGDRDKAILLVLLNTGARASEFLT
jgi:site-specific recombinase XerD